MPAMIRHPLIKTVRPIRHPLKRCIQEYDFLSLSTENRFRSEDLCWFLFKGLTLIDFLLSLKKSSWPSPKERVGIL